MLAYVAKKEGLQLPAPLSQRIAQISDRNLRRALLCFETCKMSQYPFSNDQAVQITDWELYIQVRHCCRVVADCKFPRTLPQAAFVALLQHEYH